MGSSWVMRRGGRLEGVAAKDSSGDPRADGRPEPGLLPDELGLPGGSEEAPQGERLFRGLGSRAEPSCWNEDKNAKSSQVYGGLSWGCC